MKNPKQTTDGNPPADDHWDASTPQPVDSSGQHKAYWILPEEERAKGFIRPVRLSYKHVGALPPSNLRDLTEEEQTRYAAFNYIKFENYEKGSSVSSVVGRFWTQEQLDRLSGCGTVTTMPRSIAETYARDLSFYSNTFCCACKTHLPVGARGVFVWEGTEERVGT